MSAVRVWKPEEDDRSGYSLRDIFCRYLRPSLDGRRASSTLRQYETALRHWETFCTDGGTEKDPSASTVSTRATPTGGELCKVVGVDNIRSIDDQMLEAFGRAMLCGGQSSATINKTWKVLRAILRRAGPREGRNPRAVGLIDRVPSMDPVVDDEAVVDSDDGQASIFSKDQLAALYSACDVASWPTESPAVVWRCWLVLNACLGPRVEDGVTWTWEHVRVSAQSPVKSSTVCWDPGYLVWLPAKTKRKKSSRLILPLPTVCRIHLDAMHRVTSASPTIYGWSKGSRDRRRDQWKEIAEQAGMPDALRKSLRPTANVLWNRASKCGLGRWVLGHAARDINDAAYMRAEPELIEYADQLDLPDCFRGSGDGCQQLFLF